MSNEPTTITRSDITHSDITHGDITRSDITRSDITRSDITLRDTPYMRVCRVKKLCVMEITPEFTEIIKSYIKDTSSLNINCGFTEYLELTDKIGIENNKPCIYKIEIDGVEKDVLIGIVKDNITTDESQQTINNKMKRVKIIYARCEKSMKLLDPIYRDYIHRTKFKPNKIMAVKAVAGGGKTTLLLNLAEKNRDKRILYIAFNKCLITEIGAKLRRQNITNLVPKTFDALVYNSIRGHFNIERPDIQDINPFTFGQLMPWFQNKPFKLKKNYCYKFLDFCRSRAAINECDIHEEINTMFKKEFERKIIRELWDKTVSGQFLTFDGMRKLVAVKHLMKTTIDSQYDYIFIDEAQDFDPIMLNIVLNDITLPKLFVGDPKQAIYEWKGSINAFENLPPDATTHIELYTTFRMGQPACRWISKQTDSWITPYDDTRQTDIYCQGVKYVDEDIPECSDIDKCSNITKSSKLIDVHKHKITEPYVYLFRTWKGLLQTAQKTKKIWIYDYNKKIIAIRKLHEKLQKFSLTDEEKGEFEDDLPAFLMNMSKQELEQMEEEININLTTEEDAIVKMITIHSYKGMENDVVRVYNDIDIKNEPNLYYVALTRGIKDIHIDENRLDADTIKIDTISLTTHRMNELSIDTNYKISGKEQQKTIDKMFNMFSTEQSNKSLSPKKKSYEELLNEGKTITEIVKIKGVLRRTVEDNIVKLVKKKVKLDWIHIGGPDKDTIEKVMKCAEGWTDGMTRTLKAILPEVSYYHINLALCKR